MADGDAAARVRAHVERAAASDSWEAAATELRRAAEIAEQLAARETALDD